MQLYTKNFGQVEYGDEDIITFEESLPGFNDKKFILLADRPNDLFCWLQSVEDSDLAFVLMDVRQIRPDYEPQIDPWIIESLDSGLDKRNGTLSYYSIAVVPEDIKQMRVNLKAPVLINSATRKGKQVIAANEDYSVRHYIFDEIYHRQVM